MTTSVPSIVPPVVIEVVARRRGLVWWVDMLLLRGGVTERENLRGPFLFKSSADSAIHEIAALMQRTLEEEYGYMRTS